MFGYATNETEELMPATIILAHKLGKKLADCRRDETIPNIYPDTKTQVIVLFLSDHSIAVHYG